MTVTVNKLKTSPVRSGDTTAEFDQVFNDQWGRVYAVVYRIVGDPAEAEDLALETFMKLHQRPPRNWSNLSGWLYRVATNMALNKLRSEGRRIQHEIIAELTTLEHATTEDPSKIVERTEESWQVRKVLSKMKKRTARLLVLRYSGFSYTEIASIIGVNSSSVGTLLSRAEREFKNRYRELD